MGHACETIVAWQKADDLAVEVYRVTAGFSKSEIYGLTSQMRRPAVSVAANIAEGAARQLRPGRGPLGGSRSAWLRHRHQVHLGAIL